MNRQVAISHNIEIMINDEADEVIGTFFKLLKYRYQNNLESMKDSELIFDYVYLWYYKYHKINPNHGRSYIDSPDCIKSEKSTTNPINGKITNTFNIL